MFSTPVVKDVVLVGGGHSHVEVMRSFGMRPVPGARLTLITRDFQTPYSGMLPGYVSGVYNYEDIHIDLCRLARFAQCRLIRAEATGMDIKNRRVHLNGRPPIKYDIVSIDIGSSPDPCGVPGAREHATAVKPISTFIERLHALMGVMRPPVETLDTPQTLASTRGSHEKQSELRAGPSRLGISRRHLGQRGYCVVVVGGGAGGVELAFAMQHRLLTELRETNQSSICEPVVKIVTKGQILANHAPGVRKRILALFKNKGIQVFENRTVVEVEDGNLKLENGEAIGFDGCLWCTQAAAAPWIAASDLATDEKGFIKVNDFLQAFEGPAEVFAAGDVATSVSNPRPKAGVFAVRQGPPLASNIRRLLQGEELVPFVPQKNFLSLITAGKDYCVASKGQLSSQGSSLWRWKDRIDRKFMYKYGRDLPDMEKMAAKRAPLHQATAANLLERQAAILEEESQKRCGGCGGKVGMHVLKRILAEIGNVEDALTDQGQYDDAAIIQSPQKGHLLLQTTDFLRNFVSDPYIFGQVTAEHCINDIYAMGGYPTTLLATAVVPFALEDKMAADLIQIMLGAKKVCSKSGCKIAGGHTSEGSELGLGFTVTGTIPKGQLLIKAGAGVNQAVILTKALGTGMIFAAEMRGKAKAPWIDAAIQSMLTSNEPAVKIFQTHNCTACTDISGFGLIGHLSEMLEPGEVSVELDAKAIPELPGADVCSESGWLSSLHSQNSRLQKVLENFEGLKYRTELYVLSDPQTSGGLLGFVPEGKAEQCVNALREAGLPSAAIIGHTFSAHEHTRPMVRITNTGG